MDKSLMIDDIESALINNSIQQSAFMTPTPAT